MMMCSLFTEMTHLITLVSDLEKDGEWRRDESVPCRHHQYLKDNFPHITRTLDPIHKENSIVIVTCKLIMRFPWRGSGRWWGGDRWGTGIWARPAHQVAGAALDDPARGREVHLAQGTWACPSTPWSEPTWSRASPVHWSRAGGSWSSSCPSCDRHWWWTIEQSTLPVWKTWCWSHPWTTPSYWWLGALLSQNIHQSSQFSPSWIYFQCCGPKILTAWSVPSFHLW